MKSFYLNDFNNMIKNNHISHINVRFTGGGDSGDIDEILIFDKQKKILDPKKLGKLEMKKDKSIFDPKLEIWKVKQTYSLVTVDEIFDGLVNEILNTVDCDWYNNEGGGGSISIDFNTGRIELYVYQNPEDQYDEDGEPIENDDYQPYYEENNSFTLLEFLDLKWN